MKMNVVLFLVCIIFSELQLTAQVSYNIGQRTFHFNDESRSRKLTTEVWYPTHDTMSNINENQFLPFILEETIREAKIPKSKYPLILLSHGTGGNRIALQWFCSGLAKNGYIVAAVDHFGNTFDNPIPLEFVKMWERPQDLSFILTKLLSENGIKNCIDTNHIGSAGFSLGGYTVIALSGGKMDYDAWCDYLKTPSGIKEADIPEMPGLITYFDSTKIRESFFNSPSLHNEKIKCAFAMAPGIGQGFISEDQFSFVKIPIFIIGVEKDSITPVSTNAIHYSKLIKNSRLKILTGDAGHYVFLNTAKPEMKQQLPLYYSDEFSVNREDIHNEVFSEAVRFFNQHLK